MEHVIKELRGCGIRESKYRSRGQNLIFSVGYTLIYFRESLQRLKDLKILTFVS